MPDGQTINWLTATRPLVIGHRGASADAPENSLEAFVLAMEQGADGIELDVQLSADGHPVIIHDDTVDRTTTGQGVVTNLTLEELQSLRLSNGESVPTLDALFDTLGDRPIYNVELKTRGAIDRGLEAVVASCIESHGLASRVLVSSFSPVAVRRARQYLSDTIPLGMLRERNVTRFTCRLLGVQADHPEHTLIDEASMLWANANGYRVHAWTVDDCNEAQRLVSLGVHGIITNTPGAVRDFLSG